MLDPQQELFIELKTSLEKMGFAVYDGFLPPEGTPYPFIYLGESQLIDEDKKDAVFGRVRQTIHIWHNDPHKRGTVSAMMLATKQACRTIEHTSSFAWAVRGIEQRILPDNTTKKPLLHGHLSVEFSFN